MSDLHWKVVLFDLDGTLVDTIGAITSSFQHTWRHGLGQDLDPAQARSWIGRPLEDIFSQFGAEKSRELQKIYIEHNVEELPRLQKTYRGIAELISSLKSAGATLGIVTSKRYTSARLSLDIAGLSGEIELVATLADTTHHKPHPAPLLLALEKLGRAPSDTVYIGDAVVDIEAAHAAKVSSVAVTWGAGDPEALRAHHPTHLVTTTPELSSVLLGR